MNYQYYQNESNDRFKIIVYRYKINSKMYAKLSKMYALNTGTRAIYFQTKSKENYLEIKQKLKINGYKFTREASSSEGNPTYVYEKGNEEFSLTPFLRLQDGRSINIYEITYYVYK